VHETALPSPETVDLGGRCVLPGFTDSHVHFPTWALSQGDVRLHDCASLAEALDRVRAAPPTSSWLRGQGWRDADWPDGPPTRQALDEVVSDRPAMLISKDYHALWLNSAALALAGGDLEVDGGVVVRDESGDRPRPYGRRPGFKARFVHVPPRVRRGDARGRAAAARGVTALHQGRQVGATPPVRLDSAARAPRPAIDTAERIGDLRELACSGVGSCRSGSASGRRRGWDARS
jgi:predicted amidohydrolase YtcJ